MPKLTRVNQRIFGSTAPVGKIAKFGSLFAGLPVTTTDPEEIQELSNFLDGWTSAALGENSPAIEDMNALFFLLYRQLAYVFETGVPEWNEDTTYYIGNMVNDGTGVLYASLTNNNLNNVVSSTANWKRVGNGLASSSPGAIISSNYTVLAADNGRVLNVDCSGGPIEIQLPSPSPGFVITVKDLTGSASTNPISIKRFASELIDDTDSDDLITTAFSATSYDTDGTDWSRIASFAGSAPVTINRGLFAGGTNSVNADLALIDYIDLNTASNSASFGSLTAATFQPGAVGTLTRALFGGGGVAGLETSAITYVELATLSGSAAFGSLTVARFGLAACGNTTRGLFFGGTTTVIGQDTIDYVAPATLSSAASFGILQTQNYYIAACSSTTRGIVFGSVNPPLDAIAYVTIATLGNAATFGSLTGDRNALTACSSATRGLIAGGFDGAVSLALIEYVTMATLGNSATFGNLTTQRYFPSACSSKITALFAAGASGGSVVPAGASLSIDTVTIATLANATNYGNLTSSRLNAAGCSGSHGGL